MKKVKILLVLVQKFDPNEGGVQMSTFKLSKFFSEQQMDVSIYSFANTGNITSNTISIFHAKENGLNFNPLNMSDFENCVNELVPEIIINQMPYEFNIGIALNRMQEKLNFLLLGCLRGSFFAIKLNLETYRKALLPKLLQPFFKNSLGYWVLLQFHKKKHGRDLKNIMNMYDYYVLFGDPNRVELEYFIGKYKQNKLAYIPNSIPAVVESVPIKKKRILWLSRIDYRQKHAELIIPLWKLIKDQLPDWEFDLVGHGGAYEDLKKQMEEEQIERMSMYGKRVPDEFYSRSPIYIMTSSFEGFPNTLIEAQSYGSVPVVFDSYPMLREIINDTNSVSVKTFDIEQMANEVITLAKDNERRERLMIKSLVNARRFTIDEVGKKWMQLFRDNGIES